MAKVKVVAERIPVEQFVKAYMTAARDGLTRDDVAEALGVTVNTVYLRANELQRKGVPLPALGRKKGPSIAERAMAAMQEFAAPTAKVPKKK